MTKSSIRKKIKGEKKRTDEIKRLTSMIKQNESMLPINKKMLEMIKKARQIEFIKLQAMKDELEIVQQQLKQGIPLMNNAVYTFQNTEEWKTLFIANLKIDISNQEQKMETFELNDLREKSTSKDYLSTLERLEQSLTRIPENIKQWKEQLNDLEKQDKSYIG